MYHVPELPCSRLAAQQRWVHRAIVAAVEPDDIEAAVTVVGGRLTPQRRLGIYRHAYVQRLIECLRDDYPAVERAMGAESFDGHCRDYIVHHPPQSVTLNTYGADFGPYLGKVASSSPRGGTLAPWMVDLAVLEWATVCAIHATASETLSLSDLNLVRPESWGLLQLRLSPAVQLLALRHAVSVFLTEMKGASDTGAATTPIEQTSWVMVSRHSEDVWRVDLPEWAYTLLVGLREGQTLGDALSAAAERDADLDVGEVLRRFRDWVGVGVFCGYSVDAAG